MEKTKFKQNKKDVVLIRFFVFVLAFIIILPVYILADSDFSNQPLPVIHDNTNLQNGLYIGSYNNGASGQYMSSYNENTYIALYGNNGRYNWIAVCSIDDWVGPVYYWITGNYSGQVTGYTEDNYRIFYGGANTDFSDIQIPVYADNITAINALKYQIDNGGNNSSGYAILIPSTNFSFIGVNANSASVYLRSTYENNAAVALYYDSSAGGYIPYILCKYDYGVFSTIDNTETALLSSPVVIDGVTYYEKYDTSSSFLVLNPSESLGYYSSLSDAQSACIDLLETSWPAEGEANFNYNLPSGNVAFIELTERSTSYQLLCDFNYLSYASDPPWPYNGMKIGYVLDLPESDASFPFNGWNDITWIKSPTGQNLMGQTTLGIAQGSLDYSRGFFVVYVPFWGTGSVGNNSNINFNLDGGVWQNTSVTISIPFVSGITVYGLDTSVSFADGIISTETSGNGDVYTRDMTNQTDNVFTDSEGNIVNIPSGGGSNSNPISNFWSWLNTQFESLKSLFSTGHNTIQTLVGYGSTFMNKVASLYQWLPAPVYSVLVAGLSLVIIIGVVKVFL